MDKSCKVTADDSGAVIVVSKNNPEFGYIRVTQERMVIDAKGWAKPKNISALVLGTVENLKKFGWKANQEIAGRIIIKESLDAFNKKTPERDLKIAGKSGVVCQKDGQPIYQISSFTESLNAQDELVPHTNTLEIKNAFITLEEEERKAALMGVEKGDLGQL